MKNLNLTLCLVIATMIGISGASYSQMAGQPANSYVSGSKWYCSAGYSKSGNKCVSIFAGMAGQTAESAENKRRVDQRLVKEQQKKDRQLVEQRRRDKKAIAGIQRQLIGHKYLRGTADGIPGNKTSTAVKAFYRDAGITRPALDDYMAIAEHLSSTLLSPAGNCPDHLTRSPGFSVCFTINGQD